MGVDVNSNIRFVSHWSWLNPVDAPAFYKMVRNNGIWDYKQYGNQYQKFGNFNYGATGTAMGFPEIILLRAAGYAQVQAGTSQSGWSTWDAGPPYGDDPADQVMIKAGIEYARNNCQSR